MKKILLSIVAALLFGFGALAQTIFMEPHHTYADRYSFYELGNPGLLSYTPKNGDMVTVMIAGTANESIPKFGMVLVDSDTEVWCAPAEWQEVGSITKDVPFSFVVNFPIDLVKYCTPPNSLILYIDADQCVADLEGITLELTQFEILTGNEVILAPSESNPPELKNAGPFNKIPSAPVAGDVWEVTIKGTTDVEAYGFIIDVIDGSSCQPFYWGNLGSSGEIEDSEVIGGEPFEFTTEIEIQDDPCGSSIGFYVYAANDVEEFIKIYNFEISAKNLSDDSSIYTSLANSSVKVLSIPGGLKIDGAESAVIFGIDGSLVASTSASEIALPKGVYIVKAGGEVVKAIVK